MDVDAVMIGGRLHVFVFTDELAMKYAPQIASVEVNILTQPEVPSVGHGNKVAEWAGGLSGKKEFLKTTGWYTISFWA